ncbi:DNA polymerase III subunit delta [Rothia nasimurium]|uniref:DNA polymerase III subunit delta n=1 Tax=Rothia nasimurium TaxID=85336 RepID=UPI003B9F4090
MAARSQRPTASPSSSWRTVQLAPLILLHGPEEYFAQRAKARLRHLFQEAVGSYELTSLSAKDYRAGQLEVIASPSLFDEPKIIEIDHVATMNEAFLKDALNYLTAPQDSTLVILHHTGGARGKKLIDAIKASRKFPLVECKALKNDRDRLDFVIHEFKAIGRTVQPAAAAALTAATSDISELAAAIRQLAQDEQGEITPDVIDTFFGGRTEVTAFKVGDAAVAGNAREAIKLLRQALDTGSDPIPVLAALALRMRNIAKVHGTRGNSHQLAGDLKMAPWQVEAAQRDSRRYSPADLAALLTLLADTDAQLKGENLDPLYPLEKAVLAIARASRAA